MRIKLSNFPIKTADTSRFWGSWTLTKRQVIKAKRDRLVKPCTVAVSWFSGLFFKGKLTIMSPRWQIHGMKVDRPRGSSLIISRVDISETKFSSDQCRHWRPGFI